VSSKASAFIADWSLEEGSGPKVGTASNMGGPRGPRGGAEKKMAHIVKKEHR